MSYIKSPLNYVGGKYKLLPQLLPLFPTEIKNFVDLFCGGGNVGVNVKAQRKILNDIEPHLINFMQSVQGISSDAALVRIEDLVEKYELSKTNVDGFNKIREDYNNILDNGYNWAYFYSVVTHAFNYQIRYNNSGKFNMPFGKDRSWFNPSVRKNFIEFVDAIDHTYRFTNMDFANISEKILDAMGPEDFVYCDPPYLISVAAYNEKGGWTEKHEQDLLDFLDKLNERGIKFGLSNVLYHKGRENSLLIEWAKKYEVVYLDKNYDNCNHQKEQNFKHVTVEVYVKNY
jgi:DNA adenine methylase